MLSAIFTSDWHFDGLKNHFPDDHATIIGREVEKTYQYAIDNGVPYIIVPGDIADTYKISPASIRELLRILKKYDAHVTTYYMKGNHDHGDINTTSLDIFETMVEFQMLENFHVVSERKIVEIDGVLLNFCPFPYTELLPSKKPCLNIIHQDIAGAVGDNGRPLKVRHDIKINADRDFTVSGHIHKRQFLKKRRALYHGSLFQKTFGESLPKGWVHLKAKTTATTLKVKWEYVDNNPEFRLETLHITDQKQFSALSNNRLTRYRLYVNDGIVVPNKIRTQNPNIDQIHETSGKKLDLANLDEDQRFVQEITSVPAVDPMSGLAEFFKSRKQTKQKFVEGKKLVEKALSELGYA